MILRNSCSFIVLTSVISPAIGSTARTDQAEYPFWMTGRLVSRAIPISLGSIVGAPMREHGVGDLTEEENMYFVVHCVDREGALERRLANYEAHKAYLASAKVRSIISGPLVSDEGETMIGSFFLVEAERKEDVIAFNRNDPFSAADVWGQVSIHPFLKRVDNRE
ncbi:YciI family protein [Burkholderia stabilis]|uniref:YciI family protein n=1 Tax=Burkholderia stabilis TaxID=95485 RepID=UPI00300194C3